VSDHPFQPVAFEPIGRDDLNACLSTWKHRMGELRRPTRGWNHGLRHGGELIAVVATDTLIRPRVAGFDRRQAIELSRLCAVRPDICRVALRLWRLFVFPAIAQERGCSWAISYQDAALHSGALYRFDGWVRARRVAQRRRSEDRTARPKQGDLGLVRRSGSSAPRPSVSSGRRLDL